MEDSPRPGTRRPPLKRKRVHDGAEDLQSPPPPPPPPPPPLPVLAPRSMFFIIHPAGLALPPPPPPISSTEPSNFDQAVLRIQRLTDHLTGDMRSSLTATLTVLHRNFPNLDATTSLIRDIVNLHITNDGLLLLADRISLGLTAFLAKGGREVASATTTPDTPGETASTPSQPPKSKARSSQRSARIRENCRIRDASRCCFCKTRNNGLSCHVIPFSLRGRKSLNFWSFVSLFCGEAATAELKAAALDPNPENADNLKNVLYLCHNCHALFDDSRLSMVPTVLEDVDIEFPYDPARVHQYYARCEFPFGADSADVVVIMGNNKFSWMQAGDIVTFSTSNPEVYPLPHPLLFQLHTVVSRILYMKAAAGYPVLRPSDDSGSDIGIDDDVPSFSSNEEEGIKTPPSEYLQAVDRSPPLKKPALGKRREWWQVEHGPFKEDELPRDVSVVVKELSQRARERQLLMDRRMVDELEGGCD